MYPMICLLNQSGLTVIFDLHKLVEFLSSGGCRVPFRRENITCGRERSMSVTIEPSASFMLGLYMHILLIFTLVTETFRRDCSVEL